MTSGRTALAGPSLLLAVACSGGSDEPGDAPVPVQEPAPEPEPGPFLFVDRTRASGLGGFSQLNGTAEKLLISETFGAGVALFDYDRDGDPDAYLTNGSAHGLSAEDAPGDALYANDGAGRFEDRTAELGLGDKSWTAGVRVGDFDDDGWSDLYLTNHGPNVLYRNDEGSAFVDVTAEAGVADPRWSTGSAFVDFDEDGDLDLYVANYVEFDREWIVANDRYQEYKGVRVFFGPHGLPPSGDRLYVNDGAGVFEDASERLGIAEPARYGFQVVVFDYDEDGWTDLYVANDSEPNLLWRNEAGVGFVDEGLRQGLALSADGRKQAGMGVALGDYDGNLLPDFYVTNFADDYFALYRNLGDSFFGDVTVPSGLSTITNPLLGWGCGFHDFDADGDVDLYAVNGHVYPQVDRLPFGTTYHQPGLIFENRDSRLRRVADGGGDAFRHEDAARGSAVGDVDGDGDLDLLIGNLDGPPRLLLNEGEVGRSVRVLLVGSSGGPWSWDVIGARAVGRAGDLRMARFVGAGPGFLSSDEPWLHFGVGEAEGLDDLVVTWPDGSTEAWDNLEVESVHRLQRGSGAPR